MEKNKIIVLFDGVCNLCNSLLLFIIKRDKSNKFIFASLQSDPGIALLLKHRFSRDNLDTFVLISDDILFTKSTASLRLLKELGSGWKLFYIFIIIPKSVRDYIYELIANSRYRIFGKRETCMRPTVELKSRFLD